MRRLVNLGVGVLLVVVMVPLAAEPASAAQTVTATSANGQPLYGGDLMTITGSGFAGGQVVTIYQCVGTYQPVPGSILDPTQCDTDPNDKGQATADSGGSISTSMFFQSPLFTSSTPGGFDCGVNGCTVVADPSPNVDAMTMVKGNNACNGNTGAVTQFSNPAYFFTKSVTVGGHTYSSDPGNLTVNAGDTVSVKLSWNPSQFAGTPDQAWDCVFYGTPGTLGGQNLGQPYDTFEKPATTRPFVTKFTVQAAWAGKNVCDRGRVSGKANPGNPDGTDKSNQFCFFVSSSATVPEARSPLLLLGLPLVLGGFLIRRRRSSEAGSVTAQRTRSPRRPLHRSL